MMAPLSVTVTEEADLVTVMAEQVFGEEDTAIDDSEIGVAEDGAGEGLLTLVVKVVRPTVLDAAFPLQVPNSFWHRFATSQ